MSREQMSGRTGELRDLTLGQVALWRQSWLHRVLRLARREPLGTMAFVVLLLIWLVAAFAPWIARYYWHDSFDGPRLTAPNGTYWFGTDGTGRDVFSQVVWGGRLSLGISFVGTAIGLSIGSLLGVVSGYVLGSFDLVLQRILDAFQAFPALILLMVIVTILGTDLYVVALALVVVTIPFYSRVVRSTVLAVRENSYVEAARSIGAGDWRIMVRHVVPNSLAPVIVLAAFSLGANLLSQAALSFLGLASSQYPDWGGMLNAGARNYMENAPWLAIAPGVAIAITVFAYNVLGDTLRDVLDPRLRGT